MNDDSDTGTDGKVDAVRSRIMASVRGKDTKPEMIVRRYLHGLGFRYSLHSKRLPGRPDIVLPRYRAVVFVHGCFWHHHPGCRYASVPKTRRDFWLDKFATNSERDARNVSALEAEGWNVTIVWECQTRTMEGLENSLSDIVAMRGAAVVARTDDDE